MNVSAQSNQSSFNGTHIATRSVSILGLSEYFRRLEHDCYRNIIITPVIGIRRVYQKMLVHLMLARETVYLNMWCCDFTIPLHGGKSLHDWIQQACSVNPKLHIYCLLHENVLNRFPEGFVKETCKYPHSQVTVKLVPMYNPSTLGYWFHGHTGLNCLHQKWVLFDRTHLLWGGCDVRDIYTCNYPNREPNMDGWYWSDLTLMLYRAPLSTDELDVDLFWDLPREWTDFLQTSVQTLSKESRTMGAIAMPFINQFSLPLSEEAMYVHLIEQSEQYVYIENQYFYSSNRSGNRVMLALVARIERAVLQKQRNFRVFIVTNWKMQDEKSVLNVWGLQSSLCSSMATLRWTGTCTWEQLEQHIWIGYLQVQGPSGSDVTVTTGVVPVYTHTKWLCIDSVSAIHSSSNLCDRSLSRENSDTELGLVIFRQPLLVDPIQQEIWLTHAGPPLRDMIRPSFIDATAAASASASSELAEASDSSVKKKWSYLDLFDHLRVARDRKQTFGSFCAMDQQLPIAYVLRGTAFEMLNRSYL